MSSPKLPSPVVAGVPRRVIAPIAMLMAAACASTDSTDPIRNLPPASLLVAVEAPTAPLTSSPGAAGEFRATPAEVQRMLTKELQAMDASSRVVAADELAGQRPDVVVRLVPTAGQPVAFQHEGTSNFLGAGGLWLVTWIGGMFVPDSRYSVAMDAKFQIALGDAWIERPIGGDEVDLTFFDRNDLLSVQGLQSLVLPPFWTSDQADKTGASLTEAAVKIAARQITVALKSEFEQAAANDFGCAVQVTTPKNGQAVAGTQMPIELVALSRSEVPVSRVAIGVNGSTPAEIKLGERVGEDGIAARGTLHGLDPARENTVRIEVTTDRIHTRTLRLAARN
jgi:hypothetical protein